MRDRVVLSLLGGGVVIAPLAWRPLGPWAAMLLGLASLLAASMAYRLEMPRIDLNEPLPPLDGEAVDARSAPSPSEVADQ